MPAKKDKTKTKKETTKQLEKVDNANVSDSDNDNGSSFLDKTKKVASNVSNHIKKNWKTYALGAAVGTAAARYKYGGNSASTNTNKSPTKKPIKIKDVPLVAPKSTSKPTPKPVVKKIDMSGWVAKNTTNAQDPYIPRIRKI
jgi:hypothetical protein